jgi:hypothetical protein
VETVEIRILSPMERVKASLLKMSIVLVTALAFFMITNSDIYTKRYEFKELSIVIEKHKEHLNALGITFFEFDMCEIRSHYNCKNTIKSKAGDVEIKHLILRDAGFDNFKADLMDGNWVAQPSLELKRINKSVAIKNFESILDVYLSALKKQKINNSL